MNVHVCSVFQIQKCRRDLCSSFKRALFGEQLQSNESSHLVPHYK